MGEGEGRRRLGREGRARAGCAVGASDGERGKEREAHVGFASAGSRRRGWVKSKD